MSIKPAISGVEFSAIITLLRHPCMLPTSTATTRWRDEGCY